MDLIYIVLIFVLIGFLVWLLTSRVPMPPGYATAIQTIVLVLMILYLIVRLVGGVPDVLPRR